MAFNPRQPYNELPDLPPEGIDLETPPVMRQLASAARYLGELNGLCNTLPNPQLLINTIVLQESKSSTAIENIVTTQDELYKAAAENETENHAAKEVLNYREALYAGLSRMEAQDGLIVTNTMIEIMQTIKENTSSIRVTPGVALKSALNAEVIYTPPTGEQLLRSKLTALERFINEPEISSLDPLIKLAMIHYQFESIHPFADGNGRTGRILNALYLVQQGLLPQPILYLSSYIMQYKTEYYQFLRGVTERANWQDWIMFMLTAIAETSKITLDKIRRMTLLKKETEEQMREVLGASFSYELLELMFALPYLKIDILEAKNIAHRQTASSWLNKLTDAGILEPKRMGRPTYYINQGLMDILGA